MDMEKLTTVSPAPGESPEPGWPHESWREYADHCFDHDDVGSPAALAARKGTLHAEVDPATHVTVLMDGDTPLPRYPQRGERGWDWP